MTLTKEERKILRLVRKGMKTSWTTIGFDSWLRDLFNIIARQNDLKPVE